MDEGYVPVARLHREREGRPVLLEMRAEQLKDYLCARGMALYVVSYRDREEIVRDAGHIAWATEPAREESGLDRWEGHVTASHEGGDPFGSTAAVIHIGRTSVDAGVDVPTISVSDEVISETYTIEREGARLFRVYGELWRKEWVYPGLQSPRVRRDDVPAVVSFIIDAAGTRATADALTGAGRWLWFRPEVIMALAHRRGGALQVGSRDMGRVRCSPDSGVVFGVNTLGLVNVYAKDIAMLPAWQQQVWAGYTLTPEGGVAAELFAAQAEGRAARTRAPEAQLPESIALLNDLAQQRWGFSLFREHEEYERLLRHAHRFRSVNQEGLFALAKDLARLTADSIDTAALQKLVQPQKGEQWGSLKTLEHALAINVGGEDARSLLGPLVGIYNLRHADAHLPTSDLTAAYALAKVNPAGPFVTQGYELLQSCVATLEATAAIIKQV
jgi:hypothetical protein